MWQAMYFLSFFHFLVSKFEFFFFLSASNSYDGTAIEAYFEAPAPASGGPRQGASGGGRGGGRGSEGSAAALGRRAAAFQASQGGTLRERRRGRKG